jgi:hypothetical protein
MSDVFIIKNDRTIGIANAAVQGTSSGMFRSLQGMSRITTKTV